MLTTEDEAKIKNGSLHEIAAPRQGYCGKAGNP